MGILLDLCRLLQFGETTPLTQRVHGSSWFTATWNFGTSAFTIPGGLQSDLHKGLNTNPKTEPTCESQAAATTREHGFSAWQNCVKKSLFSVASMRKGIHANRRRLLSRTRTCVDTVVGVGQASLSGARVFKTRSCKTLSQSAGMAFGETITRFAKGIENQTVCLLKPLP